MDIIKIAITGGPSGGKTTLIETLKHELGKKCRVVPEAASILYRGGFPRQQDPVSRIHVQKAIYYTQKELELMICKTSQSPLIICDRGSLDALAYWPDEPRDFFSALQTSREEEFDRYQWVLHLDTADLPHYDSSNPIRTESHDEALTLNQRTKQAWEGHPRRIIISQNDDFLSKMTTALAVIRAIEARKALDEIHKELK